MSRLRLVRVGAAALAAALMFGGVTLGALAQEYPASTVTIGGGVTGTAGSDASVLAPGVVISGGTVVNSTGIGVDSGGGSSIGTTTGGDDSAAIVE